MRIYKSKNRLIISAVIGVIAVLIYSLILVINGFEINESNLFIALMLPGLFIKLFLFFAALTLLLTSIAVLFSKYRTKTIFIYIIVGLIVVLITGIPEYQKIQSYNLFELTQNETLDTTQVIAMYEKAIEKGDIRAISNIAAHCNLPDSIQQYLSGSEYMEVRRKIAWKTESKELLVILSSDKDFEVRMAVATNKLTPIDIVDSLQYDTNEYVKNTAFAMYKARTVK